MLSRCKWIGAVALLALVGAGCFNGDGTHLLNSDAPGNIHPGLYRTAGSYSSAGSCYWERQGPGGAVIAKVGESRGHEDGPLYVDIKPTDTAFYNVQCDWWVLASLTSPFAVPGQPFGSGDYMVGREVVPGTYNAPGTNSTNPLHQCSWQRVRGWSGETTDNLGGGSGELGAGVQVTIEPTDVGFRSNDCGTWTKVG